jgi:hypothetical protein
LKLDALRKFGWKKVIAGAVAFLIIAQVIHLLSSLLTFGYYMDPSYFSVWSKVMMPGPGGPPMEFYFLSIAFSLITGMIYSGVYVKVEEFFKDPWKIKGMKYGIALFLLSGVPLFLTTYLIVNVPMGLLLSWLMIDGLATYILGALALAWMNK